MIDVSEELETALKRIAELERRLKKRDEYWQGWNDRASRRNRELERRLEVMREWMDLHENVYPRFLWNHPEAEDWFDEDGEVR